jgi:hypothetical protein
VREFPTVELVKTGLHLLPKPYIVIKIVLDELLQYWPAPAGISAATPSSFACSSGVSVLPCTQGRKTGAGVKQGSKGLFTFENALNVSLAV